jgi:hypothetical protein
MQDGYLLLSYPRSQLSILPAMTMYVGAREDAISIGGLTIQYRAPTTPV